MQPMIKIVRAPASEAPEWVRQAWVGLVLPCDPYVGYGQNPEKGVLSLKENEGIQRKRYSYAVLQQDAIDILRHHSPNAASWWRIHGFPMSTPGEDRFSFAEDEAEVVQGVVSRQQSGIVYDDMETGRMEPWICPKGFVGAP